MAVYACIKIYNLSFIAQREHERETLLTIWYNSAHKLECPDLLSGEIGVIQYDLVLTCLLANLCSQLGLQLPSPQLVVPSSSPILLHFALPDPGEPQIRWSRCFCVQCHFSCHSPPLTAQAHNSFSCCSSPPMVTNSTICRWHPASNFLPCFISPLITALHWWVDKLWRFSSFFSWFHSTITFSELEFNWSSTFLVLLWVSLFGWKHERWLGIQQKVLPPSRIGCCQWDCDSRSRFAGFQPHSFHCTYRTSYRPDSPLNCHLHFCSL